MSESFKKNLEAPKENSRTAEILARIKDLSEDIKNAEEALAKEQSVELELLLKDMRTAKAREQMLYRKEEFGSDDRAH